MDREQDKMFRGAVDEMQEQSVRESCPTCKRGAVNYPIPDWDDIEALTVMRDGFNQYRRNFTPQMEERFARIDRVILYLSAMQGSQQ